MTTTPLAGRLAAEAVGTAVLAAVLIGSGFSATALSGDDAVRLLVNVLASALALGVLIALLAPVSGAHLNPLVTAGAWWAGRRVGGPSGREAAGYALAQLGGAVAGAVLANAMYGRPALELSGRPRAAGHLWLGEAVATGVLVLLVLGLARAGRERLAPVAVAGWIGAACWGTSSGGFANPALTVGRSLSDGLTGIAPGSVPAFVLAQCAGAAAGLALVRLLFGRAAGGRPGTHGATDGGAAERDGVRELPGRRADGTVSRPGRARRTRA
jgi:glycerol uptake facilitator-like aquaporin